MQDKSLQNDSLPKVDSDQLTVRRKSSRNEVLAASDLAGQRLESPELGRRLTRKALAEESARLRDEVTGRHGRLRRPVTHVDPVLEPVAVRRKRLTLAAATAAALSTAATAAADAAAAAAAEAADARAAARAAGCEGCDSRSGASRGLEDDLSCPICSELLVSTRLHCHSSVAANPHTVFDTQDTPCS